MLAHELRNPLGTISNALEVLRMQGVGDDTTARAIDAAERQVLHQAMLIDDLLEASRVTRGEVELQCEELDLVRAGARDRRRLPGDSRGGRNRARRSTCPRSRCGSAATGSASPRRSPT